MKKIEYFSKKLLLSITLFSVLSLNAKVSKSLPGSENVSVHAYDYANGTWYLGKNRADGENSFVSVDAFDGVNTPTVTALATDALLDGKLLDTRLALSYLPNTTTPVLAFHESTTDAGKIGLYKAGTATPVKTTVADNAEAITTGANFLDFAVSPTGLVVAVKEEDDDTWGSPNSGLRFLTFTSDLTTTARNFIKFNSVDGEASHIELQSVTDDLSNDVAPTIVAGTGARVVYHPGVKRYYVGIGVTSGAIDGHSVGALSCFYDNSNTLTNIPLNADVDGYGNGSSAATSNIVAVTEAGGSGAKTMTIKDMAPMTTSTGKQYLIVNGGLGAANAVNAKVFALPLVDFGNDSNTNKGALAAVIDKSTGVVAFNKKASGSAELYDEEDVPAIVGGEALHIAVDDAVTQMVAIGDTVYCSVSGTNATGDLGTGVENGIFYSTATFNNKGAICSWSDWKKAAPNDLTGSAPDQGKCFAFAVDHVKGRIYAIDDADKKTVHVNQWTRPTDTTTFGGQVNSKLTGGCYSMLNLGGHLQALGDENTNRYALFGGDNKVVVVKTGTVHSNGHHNPEAPTNDWDAAANAAVSLTSGLEGVGPINAISYCGNEDESFIIVGTNKGAYVLLESKDGKFFALSAITEPVVKIVTQPDDVGCIVLTRGKDGVDKIWFVSDNDGSNDNLDNINDSVRLFGTTKLANDPFENVNHIYDIAFISHDGKDESEYQIIAATDKGLFITECDNGISESAVIGELNWKQIGLNNHKVQQLVAPAYARQIQHLMTVKDGDNHFCGVGIPQSNMGLIMVNDGESHQGDDGTLGVTIQDWLTNSSVNFGNLDQIMFLSKIGAFRFLSQRVNPHSNTSHSKMTVLPYDVKTPGGKTHTTVLTTMADTATLAANTKTVYWIADVGAGYIMAGTDNGVLVLS